MRQRNWKSLGGLKQHARAMFKSKNRKGRRKRNKQEIENQVNNFNTEERLLNTKTLRGGAGGHLLLALRHRCYSLASHLLLSLLSSPLLSSSLFSSTPSSPSPSSTSVELLSSDGRLCSREQQPGGHEDSSHDGAQASDEASQPFSALDVVHLHRGVVVRERHARLLHVAGE